MDNAENWFLDFYNTDVGEITLTRDMTNAADMICQLYPNYKEKTLLDLCCGKGYLSEELFRRGWSVTGVDLSEKYINYARQKYQTDECDFVWENAETFRLKSPADVVINWHTSMAYSENDDKNKLMFQSISDNLKERGTFMIETLNPLYIRNNFQRFLVNRIPYQDSTIITIRESFIEGNMLKSDWLFIYPNGERKTAYGQTKMYTSAEFERMLSEYRLIVEKVFGDNLQSYHINSPRMILVGRKI